MSKHLLTYLEDNVPNLDEQFHEFAQTYLNAAAQIQLEDHTETIPRIFTDLLESIAGRISLAPEHKDKLIHALIWYYDSTKNGANDAFDLVDTIFEGQFKLGLRLMAHTPLHWSDQEVDTCLSNNTSEDDNNSMLLLCETDSLFKIMQILVFRQQMAATTDDGKRSALWRAFSCQLVALPVKK